eukprot:TRINITY_DN41141_c0_g2_i1.p1 TRINITY_DN41141_c0_g2~~TRINITY_DN41141_c0_g2_i1.p1  ORF type:complete len:129 (-),score=2.86 TRINITY_DN41141_c0_g2_i1:111-497(-)
MLSRGARQVGAGSRALSSWAYDSPGHHHSYAGPPSDCGEAGSVSQGQHGTTGQAADGGEGHRGLRHHVEVDSEPKLEKRGKFGTKLAQNFSLESGLPAHAQYFLTGGASSSTPTHTHTSPRTPVSFVD